MNFTLNLFYPIVTAFTTLWTANAVNRPDSCLSVSPATTTSTAATATATGNSRSRSHRTRRVSRSTTMATSESLTRQPVLRRSARLRRKYVIPEKPILSHRRRPIRREGAISNLQQQQPLTGGNTTTTTPPQHPHQQLKREDSFILVDFGNHFGMVKPAYAKRYFHQVPDNFTTVAPYHALGASVVEQELVARLLAVQSDHTDIGTKRVRFDDEDDGDGSTSAPRPRKRPRLS